MALAREWGNPGAVGRWLHGQGICFAGTGVDGGGGRDGQTPRIAPFGGVLSKRWVVERSFSWLEKNRRLWKNCERKLSTSLQMVVLAFLGVLLRRL